MTTHVQVRELVAWGIDENGLRPTLHTLPALMDQACAIVSKRQPMTIVDPILTKLPALVASLLAEQHSRPDLHSEMQGLEWTTGVVDLRQLLAFQRRLIFDDHLRHDDIPSPESWTALMALTFGAPVSIEYKTLASDASEFLLQSENPNFNFRAAIENSHIPFQLHGGSPFFEVAEYRGRWFLRDGYHRAYRLLRANITHVPAVIVHAKTLAELGATQPWFFSQETLFSPSPPRVIDFLEDNLVVEYTRPRLLKTLHVTIKESVEPVVS